MSRPEIKALAWTDLETTGLDPREDFVLDVGVVLTDLDLREITDYEALVNYHYWAPIQDRLDANPVAAKLHTDTGLIDALTRDAFLTLEEVDAELERFLTTELPHAEPGEVLLCGSGVARFDRGFITEHLPRFGARLHYAELDLGVLRRSLRFLGAEDWVPRMPDSQTFDGKAHRGLADAQAHLREARAYARTFSAVHEDLARLSDLMD